MNILSIICNKTGQKVYDYVCEYGFEEIAMLHAEKRFNDQNYRFTLGSDYDHTYNKEIDEGYEIIGIIDDNVQPSEYCGQTGY